jgi:stalled ribosome alternative rescue factor ArfA
MKDRRKKGVKRRNPIARLLRDPLFRARQKANRRKYSRKAKHQKREAQQQPSDGS